MGDDMHRELEIAKQRSIQDITNHEREQLEVIMNQYVTQSEQFERGNDTERVKVLYSLYQVREFSGWMLGDFLLRMRDEGTNVSQWVNEREDILGFDDRRAAEFLRIRAAVDLDTFKRLGTKKSLAVAQIKSPEKREAVIERVLEKAMPLEAVRKEVDKAILAPKVLATKEREKERKQAEREVRISVKLSGKQDIIIHCGDEDTRDHVNTIVQENVSNWKVRISREIR